MGACYCERQAILCEYTQYLCPFIQRIVIGLKKAQHTVFGRNSWRIYDEAFFSMVYNLLWYGIDTIFKVYPDAFLRKLIGQCT